ncbi:hypothetical protein GA0070624_3352 [Micromonospora rhizosphaerae]|uniref:Uncharacterized protein n=1 Tax=Micromonospora rhizosphaerae TaxID=568872 RepID=A0A1C6SB42_9ACTN|nr:hypothetical protein GA0070624_3352 [Micromonospora rhizosphaerae]
MATDRRPEHVAVGVDRHIDDVLLAGVHRAVVTETLGGRVREHVRPRVGAAIDPAVGARPEPVQHGLPRYRRAEIHGLAALWVVRVDVGVGIAARVHHAIAGLGDAPGTRGFGQIGGVEQLPVTGSVTLSTPGEPIWTAKAAGRPPASLPYATSKTVRALCWTPKSVTLPGSGSPAAAATAGSEPARRAAASAAARAPRTLRLVIEGHRWRCGSGCAHAACRGPGRTDRRPASRRRTSRRPGRRRPW